MSKDYVSKELARKLQEKGYPLKKVYRQDEAPLFYELPQEHPDWSQCDAWYLPSIWEVLKWLRKENKIHVKTDILKAYPEAKLTYWGYNIVLIDKYEVYHSEWNSNSCEQAALAGIEYVLENLI